jgi:hypothetical protein
MHNTRCRVGGKNHPRRDRHRYESFPKRRPPFGVGRPVSWAERKCRQTQVIAPAQRLPPWLMTLMVQCGWAASRKKDSYYKAQFNRLRGRRGGKKAICAVAASMLTAIDHTKKKWYRTRGPRCRPLRSPFHRDQSQAPGRPDQKARRRGRDPPGAASRMTRNYPDRMSLWHYREPVARSVASSMSLISVTLFAASAPGASVLLARVRQRSRRRCRNAEQRQGP